MANVLLLRAPTLEPTDRYEEAFKSLGYYPLSVPVLETVVVNSGAFKDIIRTGATALGYSAVIVTSSRACEAWKIAVQDLLADTTHNEPGEWQHIPFYVVGKATGSALASIRDVLGDTPLAPVDIRGGSESGTGQQLANFILADLTSSQKSKKLLYLTGDKNRDTLPTILTNAGVDLHPFQVYETEGSSTFEKDLEKTIAESVEGFDRWWVVFFAPSAAEFAASTLQKYFRLPLFGTSSEPLDGARSASVAAIGPTTATFLREKLGLRVDACPPNPTPQDLSCAVLKHDHDHQGVI